MSNQQSAKSRLLSAKKNTGSKVADAEQIKLRDRLNSEIYSFPDRSWNDQGATKAFLARLSEIITKLDLDAHPRLQTTTSKQPLGIVYEDVYEPLLRLFRIYYTRSKGYTFEGDIDPSLASVDKSPDR